MTKIAIIAATQTELAPVRAAFGDTYIYSVSGIGSTATAIATLSLIATHQPHLIVQVGIAGAISTDLAPLESVVVARDYQADLGAWRGDRFEPFESAVVEYPYVVDGFRSVSARTVATACATWIDDDSEIETMEGAAFMIAASSYTGYRVRFMQMRVISNYVAQPRCEWMVAEAITAIPSALGRLLCQ